MFVGFAGGVRDPEAWFPRKGGRGVTAPALPHDRGDHAGRARAIGPRGVDLCAASSPGRNRLRLRELRKGHRAQRTRR